MDDVVDADYVVLGSWENQFFDEMWHDAQEYSKPTVTPKFVFESYENGRIMDPNDYRTREPKKSRRNRPRSTMPRPTTTQRRRGGGKGGRVEGVNPPSSGFSKEPPFWLGSFKNTERVSSLQHIGTLLKGNPELTYRALAIYLFKKVSLPGLVPHA